MAFWEAGFSGIYGGAYRLRVNVDVLGQEASNNRTLIRYNAWMEQIGSSAYSVFNSSTSGHTNINGYNPARGGSLSLNGPGQRRYLAQNEDYWIAHDSNGDANPFFGADYNTGVSQVLASSAGGNFGMPHINRYANIVYFGADLVTDASFRFNWGADAFCDYVSWWSVAYDGGGHHDIPVGGTGGFEITLSSLLSDHDYDVTVAVRRADSGLWTNSGTIVVHTGSQNNFFDMGGL